MKWINGLLATLALALAAQAAERPAVLLVGNKADATLSFVDSETGKTLGMTTTGQGPHEVAATPDGKLAFVANYEGAGDSISVVDVPARKELRKIPIAPYRAPHGIAVSRDGKRVYATCERSGAVIELDVAPEKVTRSFRTGQQITHMLVLTPDGKRLYTANIVSGTSSPIDLQTGTVGEAIETDRGCEGVDVSPDGREVWTANNAADTVSVIDTRSDKVVAKLACPGFPIRVKFIPDGKRALVSCPKTNEVAVWDVASRKEMRRIKMDAEPIGILIHPDGSRAWIANSGANKVSVLDLKSLEITGAITTGRVPDGLALALQ